MSLLFSLLALPVWASVPPQQVQAPLVLVPAERVRVEAPFWVTRQTAYRQTALPALLDRVEQGGYLANFDLVSARAKEGHVGGPEADATVYESIEAVALAIRQTGDDALRVRVEAWFERIAAAQEKDGYLQTYLQVSKPGARFDDARHNRELFCLGRLIDAALSWEQSTGDDSLLEVALAWAGRCDEAFQPDGVVDPPGRPGVEGSLVRLFRRTQNEDWLWFADDLITRRGSAEGRRPWGLELQDGIPARKLFNATGDAMGLVSLHRGMADEFAATGEYALLAAGLNGWRELCGKRMYITGGVGSEPTGQLLDPFELPHNLARCEPAVAVELALWSRRLRGLTRQAAFADMEEVVVYNALAAGLGLGGEGTLEACPMESTGGLVRRPWHPDPRSVTALARFLPVLAEGAYAGDEDEIYVAHYLAGNATLLLAQGEVTLTQTTDYPWSGDVKIHVQPEKPMRFTLHVRVPAWVPDRLSAGIDDSVSDLKIDRGDEPGMWLSWEREWVGGEVLTLGFPMEPERVTADLRVAACAGRVALRRGPLIYAVESVDNAGQARSLALPPDSSLTAEWEEDLLGGAMVLRADAQARGTDGAAPHRLTAIPFALIANREPGPHAVWLPEQIEGAQRAGEVSERVEGATLRASQCHRLDSLSALVDGQAPKRSEDPNAPRMTFRPRAGTSEWLQIDFDEPVKVAGVRVFWVADDMEYGCSTPRSWRLFWRDEDRWVRCVLKEGSFFWNTANRFCEVGLETIRTRSLRMELQLRPDRSAGLFEWEIQRLE